MPAIQVYKSKEKGVMVPVQEAKIAKAYQCPWTGKLYASKKSYVKHLSDLRTSRLHKNARYKLMQKKKEDFQKLLNGGFNTHQKCVTLFHTKLIAPLECWVLFHKF